MGGVLSVVEIVLAVGFIAEGVAEAVIKAQIKELMKGHEEEFRLMNQLYQFVDVLLNQKNLVSQLNANVLFATTNWNSIMADLEDKNDLLLKIIEKFPDVKTSNFNFTFTNGLLLTVSFLAFGYISYNFISGKVKVQLSKDLTAFKDFFKTTSARVRGTAPEIRASRVNQNGVIQTSSHGTNAERVPPQTRDSNVERVKTQEKQGWKSRAVLGLRVIFVAVAIYGFVNGIINLIALQKQLDKYREYFKEEGEFEVAKEGVIELMNYVAVDIFNLANASRAGFYDSKNMFFVLSISLSRFHEKALDFAKRLDAQEFGLTQDFIDKSKGLIDSCNSVTTSGQHSKDKLKDLEKYFRIFFDDKNPQKVFLGVSIELSKVVGEYSLISDSIYEDQSNVNRFITSVSRYFEDYRDYKDFESQPINVKQKADTDILNRSFSRYLIIFDLPDITIDQADAATKDILFQVIISYTEKFYYDDTAGLTLFNKNIADFKDKVNYNDLLTAELSKANIIPVRRQKQQEEKKEVQTWLKMAKDQNEKEGFKYWGKDETPKTNFRYLRLQVEQYTNAEGKVLGTLSSFEGMRLTMNITDFFAIQRSVLRGTIVLKQL